MDCTLAVHVELMRIHDVERQRRAAVTHRASVDAVLFAQAFHRDDTAAGQAIINNCDIHSVAFQLCGFLFAALRHFDVDIEERLSIWLNETRAEIGEPS
jgi:hypothetical protein